MRCRPLASLTWRPTRNALPGREARVFRSGSSYVATWPHLLDTPLTGAQLGDAAHCRAFRRIAGFQATAYPEGTMSHSDQGAEEQEPQITDLPEPTVSNEDAAQVKAGGETLLQPFTGLVAIDASAMATKTTTTVNGRTVIDGVAMTFSNESYSIGDGSSRA